MNFKNIKHTLLSNSILSIFILFLYGMLFYSCTNPFAPKLSDKPINAGMYGDQRTIEGVFQNFKTSYLYKDTIAYGRLLSPDFVFIYRNYDKGVDASWGRDQDMISTAGLFNASQALELVWNDIIVSSGDSSLMDISRGFNLTITFNPSDIIRLQGRVNVRIRRDSTDIWRIIRWRDESNY